MLKTLLRSERYARVSRRLRKGESLGLSQLRTLSKRSLAAKLRIKRPSEKGAMAEFQALLRLSSVRSFSGVETTTLLKAGIRSLSEVAAVSGRQLVETFRDAGIHPWTTLDETVARERAETLLAYVRDLRAGRMLHRQIPGLRRGFAAELVRLGIYTAEDLAETPIDDLVAAADGSGRALDVTQARRAKAASHLLVGAWLPRQVLALLRRLGIRTIIELAAASKSRLAKDLCRLLQGMTLEELYALYELLVRHYQKLVGDLGGDVPPNIIVRLQALVTALTAAKPRPNDPALKKQLCELAAVLVDVWVDWADDAIPPQVPPLDQCLCDCEWDDSAFSERAYLLGYLLETFYAGPDALTTEFGVAVDELDGPSSENCFARTKVQETIARVQEDLRDNEYHLLIPALPDNRAKRFLDYATWQALKLYEVYPELGFEEAMKHVPRSPFRPADDGTNSVTKSKIDEWTAALAAAINSSRLHARAALWATRNEIDSEADFPPDYEYQRINLRFDGRGSYDVADRIRMDERTADHRLQRSLRTPLERYAGIFNALYGFHANLAYAVERSFGLKDGPDPSAAAEEAANEAWAALGVAFGNLGSLRSAFGESISRYIFDTVELGDIRPDNTVAKLKRFGESAYVEYRKQMAAIRLVFDKHHTRCLHICNTYFLFASGHADGGSGAAVLPKRFYVEDRDDSVEGLERIREGFTIPAVGNSANGGRGFHDVKKFGFSGSDSALFDLTEPVTGLEAQLVATYDSNEDGYVAEFSGYWYSVDHLLNSSAEHLQRLEVYLCQAVEGDTWADSNGTIPDFESLRNLAMQLIYKLPYLKQFIAPLVAAEVHRSREDYEEAYRWMLLIFDMSSPTIDVVLPFALSNAERNAARTMLGSVLMAWAEARYRENTYESIQHAKELYQLVLRLFPAEACCLGRTREAIGGALDAAMPAGASPKSVAALRNLRDTLVIAKCSVEHSAPLLELVHQQGQQFDLQLDAFLQRYRAVITTPYTTQGHVTAYREFRDRAALADAAMSITGRGSRPPSQAETILDEATIIDGVVAMAPAKWNKPAGVAAPTIQTKASLVGAMTSMVANAGEVAIGIVGGNKLPTDLGLDSSDEAFGFCAYPNPRIVALASEACYRLANIRLCRNFLGYAKSDLSIYTFPELITKARHHLTLALSLEKEYLGYYDRWLAERQKRFDAFRNLLNSEAAISLGELQLTEARQLETLADLQYEASEDALAGHDNVAAIHNHPLNLESRLIMGMFGGAGSGSMAGPVGAAVGAMAGMMSTMFSFAEEGSRAQAERTQLVYGLAIAQANRELARTRFDIVELQQDVNVLNHTLNRAVMNMLYLGALNEDTYHYLFSIARWLYRAYVDSATQFAWFAERQLEFLRGVELNTIRLNYYRYRTQGLLAAEMLQQDVEKLNFQADLSQKQRVRVTKTVSLRHYAPVRFSEFGRTGKIEFRTSADYPTFALSAGGLAYLGHWRYPDNWGQLHQRIESIEFRLIGVVGQNQDLCFSLANEGTSLVLVEDASTPPGIRPRALRRPLQSVTFSRALGENTLNLYQPDPGVLRPFEGTGVDTTWVLSVQPASTSVDLSSIYDIELVIRYSAEYSRAYEQIQRERTADGLSFVRLPAQVERTKVMSFADSSLVDQLYAIQNQADPPGFRDLRFAKFRTAHDQLGPNETSHTLLDVRFYLKTTQAAAAPVWKFSGGQVNAPAEPLRFAEISSQFETQIEDPPSSGNMVALTGFLDGSNRFEAAPPRNLNALIGNNTSVDREWVIKLVPELHSAAFHKKDLAGNVLNTRGEPVTVAHPEVLYGLTTGAEVRTSAVLIPAAALVNWDSYRWSMKVYLTAGAAIVRFNVNGGAGAYVRLALDDPNGIEVGSFDAGGRVASAGNATWPNPIPLRLSADEWHLVECTAYNDAVNSGRHFVVCVVDKQKVWEGWVAADPTTVTGTVGVQVRGNSEVYFDDLIVEQVERDGHLRRQLFADTFDGSRADRWDALDTGAIVSPFLGVMADPSPALDLSAIEDVVFMLDYAHQVKAL